MECAFGLKGKDFAIVACDGHVDFSIINFKKTEDKIRVVRTVTLNTLHMQFQIDGNKLFATAGPQAERTQFMEYIEKNINLYKLRTGIALSTRAAANFTRYVLPALLIRAYTLLRAQLAKFLRESPYNVNLLIAGYEEKTGPSLYFMDYLASIHEIPRAAHGYAAHFTLGLLDRYYKKDLTEEEGMKIIYMCIEELKTRFLVNRTGFTIKVVNKVCNPINLSFPCFRVGRR